MYPKFTKSRAIKGNCKLCDKKFKLGEKCINVSDYKTDEVVIGPYKIENKTICIDCFNKHYRGKDYEY